MGGRTPRPARPRIVDVATLAGVSRQTVSNVINGRNGFTAQTRARVEAAIAELGFQPNRYAQSLRSLRTMLVGFDLSGPQLDASNPFTISFLRAVVRAAQAHGYRVAVFAHEAARPADFRATLAAGVVDGFVLSDAPPDDYRARAATEVGVPFVALGRTAVDLPQTWVDIDNRRAMSAVVDHLVGRGCRRFAYVGHPTDVYWNRDRLGGTRERLAVHHLTLARDRTLIGPRDALRPRLARLLGARVRPDAVVTSSDSIAVQVVNLAHSLGVRVPDDVAVTGFDAGPLRTMVEPALTSVSLPVDDVAAALIERLVAELRSPTGRPGAILPTRLVVGGSA
jgi:DNA-binding LacI/PurR family transcriptional regulator